MILLQVLTIYMIWIDIFFSLAVSKNINCWIQLFKTSAQYTPQSSERLTWWVKLSVHPHNESNYLALVPSTLCSTFFWCTWLKEFRVFASTRLAGPGLVHSCLEQHLQAILPSLWWLLRWCRQNQGNAVSVRTLSSSVGPGESTCPQRWHSGMNA